MTENEEYIFQHFLISIKSGFQSLEDIIDDTLEVVEDEALGSEISDDWVRENVRREYEKHLSESKSWQHPTDTERLHKVFDELSSQHIVALHNAGYTTSDAIYDVQEVCKDIEDAGTHPVGYCYYHGQDMERVIEDGNLLIGFYGVKANNDKEAIIIGRKIVNALEKEGFDVNWNGTASSRIEIPVFNWHNLFVSHDDVDENWGYDRTVRIMTAE